VDGLSESERPSLTPPAVWIRRNRRLFGDYGFQPEPGYARTVRHATDDSGLTLLTLRRFASARGRRSPAGAPCRADGVLTRGSGWAGTGSNRRPCGFQPHRTIRTVGSRRDRTCSDGQPIRNSRCLTDPPAWEECPQGMPSTSGSMSFGGRRGAESGCRPLAARAFSVPHRGLVCKEPDHGHGHGVPWPPACGWRLTPSVDAVHLAVRPRELAGSARGQRVLRALPAAAYARPRASRCGVVGEARPGVGVVAPAAGSPAGELARRPAPRRPPSTGTIWRRCSPGATALTGRPSCRRPVSPTVRKH